MNIQNLKEVFQKFSSDNNRAILIDGPWGIGKTYNILQFLKDAKKTKSKQKIAYVSLFGKSSIDEVHTEIYSRLHPVKHNSKKIVQVIPKVAPLLNVVGDVVENLEFSLKESSTETTTESSTAQKSISTAVEFAKKVSSFDDSTPKKHHKKTKIQNIIVLDDFERLDFEKVTFTDVLGYVNSLFLQNFKVVVVCNSNEIHDKETDKFTSFKEKVFDREYIITATNDEIINSYFTNEVKPIKEYISDEFDNNLRIAQRVSNFYSEALNIIKKYDNNYADKATNESIFYACTLVVVACNTIKYTKEKQEYQENQKNQNNNDNTGLSEKFWLASLDIDNSLRETIFDIKIHLKNKGIEESNYELITGLLLLYFFNDESKLQQMFSKQNEKEQNPLLESAFYLSDTEKVDLFNRQFDCIINQNEFKMGRMFDVVKSMCKYDKFSQIDERENEIILNLLQKCDEKDLYRISDLGFPDERDNKRFEQFRNKFRDENKKKHIATMCLELRNLHIEKKFSNLLDKLIAISRESIYSNREFGKHILDKDILDTIIECNFFIDDLFGTITDPQWGVAHRICDLSIEYDFSDKIIEYIKNLDFASDQSAKERYTILLSYKFKCNN